MSLTVRKMEQTDLLAIQHLFARVGAQTQIEDNCSFVVVENAAGSIVGTVGLEKSGDVGLLRTMVIDSEKTHSMAAIEFIQLALAFAHTEGVKRVFALSSGKAELFEPLGFEQFSVTSIPHEIQQMDHFQAIMKEDQATVWSYDCSPS
ncbi:N-acetylglutamate synthase-like GNAT family acetyltransferase [Alkalihalobacillus xiaoxiensis]|uniref:N-acetylglutamate synthase-like GNAT family acetyltransferase n=1 Tax=Shouchella xiaoxiensis TaxID=766895 RepID=A0ABS2SYM8_9BACI|nr:hypothetical protein [Shouchella xiaoxiensis]MBM7840636.1 N-acetylglutamate synthase-like GNAT family acetyltransferase [Shouchella xiaoxiensis]